MSDLNPYSSPQIPHVEPKPPLVSKPTVVKWFMTYCGLMMLIYLACTGFGLLAMFNSEDLADGMTPPDEIFVQGVIFSVIGLPFAILYGVGFVLPQKKWGWIFGIVLIGIGMTSVCCLPMTIPLLIFWIKQDNKAWFDA